MHSPSITSVQSLNLALHLLYCQRLEDPRRNSYAAFSICVSYVRGGVMGLAAECMRMAWLYHQKHNIC